MLVGELISHLRHYDEDDVVVITLNGDDPSEVTNVTHDGVDQVSIDTDGEVIQ